MDKGTKEIQVIRGKLDLTKQTDVLDLLGQSGFTF
jgi:hypothetical protein